MTEVERHFRLQEPIRALIPPGTSIEVWCQSLGRWTHGFELVEWAGDRCWIRRIANPADGVLPELFLADNVRDYVPPKPGMIGRNLRPR